MFGCVCVCGRAWEWENKRAEKIVVLVDKNAIVHPLHTFANIFDVSEPNHICNHSLMSGGNSFETWYCSSICRNSMNASFHLSRFQHMTNVHPKKKLTNNYTLSIEYGRSRSERAVSTWSENLYGKTEMKTPKCTTKTTNGKRARNR